MSGSRLDILLTGGLGQVGSELRRLAPAHWRIAAPGRGELDIGDPDSVAKQLRDFYEAAGGFGTLLIVTGKKWATREKVFRSLRLFMEHVAPKLRDLVPDARDQESGVRNQAFVS